MHPSTSSAYEPYDVLHVDRVRSIDGHRRRWIADEAIEQGHDMAMAYPFASMRRMTSRWIVEACRSTVNASKDAL